MLDIEAGNLFARPKVVRLEFMGEAEERLYAGANDLQPGLAGDVGDDMGQLHVHLGKRLLPALGVARAPQC